MLCPTDMNSDGQHANGETLSLENGLGLATLMKTQLRDCWHCSALHVLSLASIYLLILRPNTQSTFWTGIFYSILNEFLLEQKQCRALWLMATS